MSDKLSNVSQNPLSQKAKFIHRLNCLQMWFIRCSWKTKVHFVQKLLFTTIGKTPLDQILNSLRTTAFKDTVVLSVQTNTQNIYDRIIHDDHRCLELDVLYEVMENDLSWFASLTDSDQFKVVIGLLRVGGGALCRVIFFYGSQLYKHRLPNSPKKYSVDNRKRWSLIEAIESELKLATTKRQSIATHVVNIKDEPESGTQMNKPITVVPNEYPTIDETHPASINLRSLHSKWNNTIRGFKSYAGIVEPSIKSKNEKEEKKSIAHSKGKKSNELDEIQLLPLWVNRKIFSYFDEKTLKTIRVVNKYWAQLVDDILNETATRKSIRQNLNKLQKKKITREEIKYKRLYELPGADLIVRREFVQVLPKPPQSENAQFELLEELSLIKDRYSFQRHVISILTRNYDTFRVMGIDAKHKLLAVSFLPNFVTIYSMVTGIPLKEKIPIHVTSVTSILVLGDWYQIITGSFTGLITCWDLRNNEKIRNYPGHTSAVMNMNLSREYLVSASLEQILIFHAHSGLEISRISLTIAIYSLSSDNESLDLYAGFQGGELIKYAIETGKCLNVIQAHDGCVTSVVVTTKFIVTGGLDTYVRVWVSATMEEGCVFALPNGYSVTSLSVVALHLLVATTSGLICIWDLGKVKIVRQLRISNDKRPIRHICSYAKGNLCQLVISTDASLEVREFLQPFTKHKIIISKQAGSTFCHGCLSKGTNIQVLPEPPSGIMQLQNLRKTRIDERIELMEYRGCVDSVLRNQGGSANTTECLLTLIRNKYGHNEETARQYLTSFPRCNYVQTPPQQRDSNKCVVKDVALTTVPLKALRKTFGHKSMLHILTPHKISL